MAKRKGVSARSVAHEILLAKGEPMSMDELATATLADPRVKLGGKTPKATIAAQVYTAAKKGLLFKQVGKGLFEAVPVADDLAEALSPGTRDVTPDFKKLSTKKRGRSLARA